MAHRVAKHILERAKTPEARVEPVQTALQMGMPLNEIEEYLDWLDMMQGDDDQPDAPSDSDSGETVE